MDSDQGEVVATAKLMLHVELGYTNLFCGHGSSKSILLVVHELIVLCSLRHIISGHSVVFIEAHH